MSFWIITLVLFAVAALFVALPLLLRTGAGSYASEVMRRNANIALFQERSDEFEQELNSGNIDKAQFDALLQELQQNLLADAGAPAAAPVSERQTSKWRTYALPLVLIAIMPVVAYLMYSEWGYIDDVELMDLFQRTVSNQGDQAESQELIVKLGEVVQADQNREWAWYFLGENFAALGMFAEAEIAYQQSADRLEEGSEKALVLGRVALTKYINSEFMITDEVMSVIQQARALNPREASVLQLLAADAEERQDYEEAIEYWRLLVQINPNSPQAEVLRQNIARAQTVLGQDVAEGGPAIDVNISLADSVQLAPETRVFVTARNAEREGMPPLAVVPLTVAQLPATVTLDNNTAVGAFNLASADTVYVSVLISSDGTANAKSGDYRSVSENFSHNNQHSVIELEVSDRIP